MKLSKGNRGQAGGNLTLTKGKQERESLKREKGRRKRQDGCYNTNAYLGLDGPKIKAKDRNS